VARVTTMEELFLDEIRDLYDAEKQLLEALPELARSVSSEELRNVLEEHGEQTETQVKRLERIFAVLGEKATGRKCFAMAGLIREANEIAGASGDTAVRDAGLIAAAQKVEHYEISGYGSARAHAEILGDDRAARLLSETLFEEKEADERLTELADSLVNEEAAWSSNHAFNGSNHALNSSANGRPKTRSAGGSDLREH
jgi:ferritin-like metal-binding protein YciE